MARPIHRSEAYQVAKSDYSLVQRLPERSLRLRLQAMHSRDKLQQPLHGWRQAQ